MVDVLVHKHGRTLSNAVRCSWTVCDAAMNRSMWISDVAVCCLMWSDMVICHVPNLNR